MIPIKNVYYMLSYAFKNLKSCGYADCSMEEFENTADLMASILIKGINFQLKRGLNKEYLSYEEPLSILRGKIDITASVKTQCILKKQLVCSYDVFSVNNYLNQILKTTAMVLIYADISKVNKKKLKHLMLYFKDVSLLNRYKINWKFYFNRNNQNYQILLNVCYLVLNGLLQTESKGKMKLKKFFDEKQMHVLYEKFILEYYKKEFPKLKTSASQIRWNLDNETSNLLLPIMQSDVMLSFNEKTLIIDAKYYEHTTQVRFGKNKVHSNNLYQIFTYVKNKDFQNSGNVAGMLLYAKTDEEITPNCDFYMSGNKISVKTLDLNRPFSEISAQLDNIAINYFGNAILKSKE